MAGSELKITKSFIDDQKISAIQKELDLIKSLNCPILSLLGNFEIHRLRGGIADYIDLVSNKKVKIRAKVDIPSNQYPTTNFVGKLMGPGASTLKKIQEQTNTKMTIRGIENQKPKANILPDHCDKLHLQIDSLGSPAEAYYKLSYAVSEVQKCLTYNLPVGYTSFDPNLSPQSNIPEFILKSMSKSRISRGNSAKRGLGKINPKFASSATSEGLDPNSNWLKTEEPTNVEHDFPFGGPVHNERNPNRVTPY